MARKCRMLRVGVIGSGRFAEQCHLPALQSHPQAKVVAIWGRRPERLQSLAARFEVPAVYTDYLELCARPDIDAITVVSANRDHAEHVVAALVAGKHVFCEKPMATDVAEADEMVRLAESSGKIHQMAFTYRYLQGLQELRRRVQAGDIGVPVYLRAHHNSWEGLQSSKALGFRGDRRVAGGGVLYDVGSHLFDLARFLMGPIQSTVGFSHRVPRSRMTQAPGAPDAERQGTDDVASAWFTHENGVQGHWFASRVMPWFGEKSHVEIVGDGGTLRASLSRGGVDELRVAHPTRPGWRSLSLPKQVEGGLPSALSTMMHSFVDGCLRGKLNANVDASFHDGFAAQLALASIERANANLPWVQLDPHAHGVPRINPTLPRRKPAVRGSKVDTELR